MSNYPRQNLSKQKTRKKQNNRILPVCFLLFISVSLTLLLLTLQNKAINSVASASSESVMIPVSEDAYISSGQPYINFGREDSLRLGGQFRTLLKFDIGNYIPSDAIIQSADLRLHPVSTSPTIQFRTHRLSNSWSEYGVNYWSDPYSSSDPFIDFTLTSFGGTQNFDITSFVQDWANGTVQNHGLELIPKYTYGSYRELRAREWTYGLRSEIYVTYTDCETTPTKLCFEVNADGYNFPNYIGINYGDYTTDDMRRMFGDNAVCQMVDGVCIPNQLADSWRKNANEKMQFGHCEGMSVTSLRFFKEIDNPSLFQSGASDTYDLSIENSRANIAYNFVKQLTDPVRTTRSNSVHNSTPNDILAQLQTMLTNGGTDPLNMAIYNFSIYSGHAITPYALEDIGNGVWRIYVYDNNFPDDANRYVVIDTGANTWSYNLGSSLGVWNGSASEHSIGLVPLSTYSESPECPWCSVGTNENTVWLNGQGHLLVTNSIGQRIGFDGTNFINEIPNAYENLPLGGLGMPVEPTYVLPTNGYTVRLDGQTTIGSDVVSVSQFGPGFALSVENIDLNVSTQDEILIASDGTQLAYQASNNEEATVRMALEQANESIEFRLQGVDVSNGQVVTTTIDLNNGNLAFANKDNNSGTYDFFFSRIDNSGVEWFLHQDLQILATDTHYLNFDSWEGKGTLILQIDHNSNGSIDETIALENEIPRTYLPIIQN